MEIRNIDQNVLELGGVLVRKYLRLHIATVIFIMLLGCSKTELPPGPRGDGFILGDRDKQAQVIRVLEDRSIPYKINSRGFVIYMLENEAEVLGIIREIEFSGRLNPNHFESEILFSKEIKSIYVKEFKKSSIPYHIDVMAGDEYIYWSQIYGPKVDRIRQKINLESR